jgi:hypothetical protein
VHDFVPQEMSHGSTAHGSSGMSGIGCFGLVGRHGSDRVDAMELQLGSVVRWLLFDHGEVLVDLQGSMDCL